MNIEVNSTRELLLDHLVGLTDDLTEVLSYLRKFPWDSPVLRIVCEKDLVSVFDRYLCGDLSGTEVERWADAIELRDDLDFATDELKEIVHRLANSDINAQITIENIENLRSRVLSRRQ